MLQKLLQPFARPARPTQVSLGESRGAEGKEPELSDEERRCEIVETFLRRDAHGGFGLFFASGGGAAVVRKVSGMWDARVSDGRRLLAPGDTVVRVGGFPTATAGDVRRQMASAETMVALTARRTSALRRRVGGADCVEAAERKPSGPTVAMEDSAAVEEEARTLKVPVDRLSWLAEPERPRETKGAESELRAGLRGLAEGLIEKPKEPKPSDDLDVIASAAERTLAPPPSKIFKEGLEFSAVGACVDINRRFGTSRPNFEILSLGQFEVGAAMARELDRVGETAKTFQRGLEADESDDGGEQRSYGAAALELAAAAGSFATAARVVLRPEFRADVVRAAEPGGQAAKRPINVAALLAPGLLLARAKHASHLAELALTLTDEDARELSEQDLEQTLLGAFASLRDAASGWRDARRAAVPRARARLRGGAAPAGEEAALARGRGRRRHRRLLRHALRRRLARDAELAGNHLTEAILAAIDAAAAACGALDAACGGDERAAAALATREARWRRGRGPAPRAPGRARRARDVAREAGARHGARHRAPRGRPHGAGRERGAPARDAAAEPGAAAPAAWDDGAAAPPRARDAAPPPPEGPSASDEAALLQKLDMAKPPEGVGLGRGRAPAEARHGQAAVVAAAGRGGVPPPPPPDGAAPPPDARAPRPEDEGGRRLLRPRDGVAPREECAPPQADRGPGAHHRRPRRGVGGVGTLPGDAATREAEARRVRDVARRRVAERLAHLGRARSALARGAMISGTAVAPLAGRVAAVVDRLVEAARRVARLDAGVRAAHATLAAVTVEWQLAKHDKPHLKHLPLSERASNVVRCARSRRELRVISREARAAGEPDDTVDAALARFDALPRPNDAVWQHETVPDADAAAYLAYDAGDDDDDDDGGGEAARRDP
ncbi:hypothetical protein JL720_11364 [Aureococcus anophagefferens]|nr:hypothetical protein JL720_11364 [Aureococcus anophagefferens]